ncbi:MAG: PilZ domain-containing protein [Labilithrix sp.]|nr:PilZ domain-containing protein [Labilithrix sp.]
MVDSSPENDPRRKVPRLPAVFAVEMSSPSKKRRCGVTRNASRKGMLIVTPSRFQVGDALELEVHGSGLMGRVGARVVRVEENTPDSREVWRYRLAVELEGALSDELLDAALDRASRAKIGVA